MSKVKFAEKEISSKDIVDIEVTREVQDVGLKSDDIAEVAEFMPEIMNVNGIDHKLLTEVDLLKLELLHAQIRAVASSSRLMSVEADQLEMRTVMKIRKMRQDANDLSQEHIELNDKKKRFIGQLSEKYGVNFSDPNTSYDTETRVINWSGIK